MVFLLGRLLGADDGLLGFGGQLVKSHGYYSPSLVAESPANRSNTQNEGQCAFAQKKLFSASADETMVCGRPRRVELWMRVGSLPEADGTDRKAGVLAGGSQTEFDPGRQGRT